MKNIFLISSCLFIVSVVFSQNSVPGACGSGPKNPSPLNGSTTLGMTYNHSECGLNYVEAHQIVETRYNQYALPQNQGTGLPVTLPISGLPNCHTILQAYLWYNVSYQSATPPATTVNFTNPVPATSNIPATNIGTDQSKCWGETGTVNYRADVTAAISGNGNYVVNITGLSNPNWEVDGVELVIIYKDNGATYQGSFVIWDGDITLIGSATTMTMTGINACAAGINAKAFNVISDRQDNISGGIHPSTLNGVTANYPNTFWCVDVANTTVTAGQTTATYGTDGQQSDCYDWSVMGLYYQTTSCVTCTPSAVSLTVTPTPSSCGAPNGTASAAASGAPQPYTYTWSTGATTTSISNLTPGSYSVNVVDATGCSTTQTFTITSSVGPAVTFVSNAVKCNGGNTGSATLTATGGQAPYTYGWITTPPQTSATANNLAAGTYSVVVSDALGCSATYSVAVTEPTVLTTTTSVVGNAMCYLSSDGSAITNPSGGTPPYIYGWTPTGQNTQTASGLAAGTYNAVVTDANGCTVSSPATITQPTAISLTQTTANASCGVPDGSASVSATGGTGAYSYLWLTSPIQITQTISNLASGTYNVLVTDANGCTQQMAITISASGSPVANFTNSPDTVNLMDALVYFTDLSTNASAWLWNFGDPNDTAASFDENPSHTYSDTGVYCITLIVTDPGGLCKDTTTHCIKVESPYTFYIPNCFTPNGDGFNEMFLGYGTYIKTFHILVFDRWGNKIFESYDITKGWDGKVQGRSSGNLVQEDVYVWKVNIVDTNDKKHNYIGHVSMVR